MMAIQFVCDVCGKVHEVTRPMITPGGFEAPMTAVPDGWGCISVQGPREKPEPGKPTKITWPKAWLVCSQACAEKGLGEAREYLRQAFEKAGD